MNAIIEWSFLALIMLSTAIGAVVFIGAMLMHFFKWLFQPKKGGDRHGKA